MSKDVGAGGKFAPLSDSDLKRQSGWFRREPEVMQGRSGESYNGMILSIIGNRKGGFAIMSG